jgi:hypothetical protein
MSSELSGELIAKIRNAKTLNEIWAAFNEFYELNDELGAVTGTLAKPKLITSIEKIVIELKVRPKGAQPKRKFLNF